ANTGNEVADGEQPLAGTFKPAVDLGKTLRSDVAIASITLHKGGAECSPEHVADRYAARGSDESNEPGRDGVEASLRDQVSAEDHDGFVRDGKAANSQDEQREEGEVSILRQPREQRFHGMGTRRITVAPGLPSLRYDCRY